MGENQHVVPHKDDWAVRGEDNTKPSSVHKTQEAAWDQARQIAENQSSEALLHGRTGKSASETHTEMPSFRLAASQRRYARANLTARTQAS